MTFNPDTKHDLYDDAMQDDLSPWFGMVTIEASQVCWVDNGDGTKTKEQWIPGTHDKLVNSKGKPLRPSIELKFYIAPCDPTKKLAERSVVDFTDEWKGIVRPSIMALSSKIKTIKPPTGNEVFNPLRAISGMWASGEWIPLPPTKEGKVYSTPLKFNDVYPNQTACEAAWKKASEQPADDTPSPQPAANGNGNAPTQTVDPNKAALVAAFPAIWAANGGDEDKFLTAIASVFKADAPEVQAFVEKNRPPF